MAAGLDGLKNAYAYLGELGPLGAVLDELVPLLRRLQNPELLQWAVFESAFAAIGAAEWEAAEARIGEAITISARNGYYLHEGWFATHLAWVARLQGHHGAALDHARRAMGLAEGTDHRWFATTADVQLACTLRELGDTEQAVALLTSARERAEREGAEGHLLRCLGPLAEATGCPDVLADADALLGQIRAPAGSAWLLGSDSYVTIAHAWTNHGEPTRAREVISPLLHAAERQGWIPALAAGKLVDGRAAAALGDLTAARSALRDAVDLAHRHRMPRIEHDATAALGTVTTAVVPP
ncbi:tetratricopeptide repeat protein [Pseudonocardia lacus]|uniref:tetratricopeptide repeat protein n=1 Tax=Pseudonocardia lacus TaxID=2835865 RepID=UPI001BDD3699|nr:tetratricopeptide repeat protein [Pseudonocardia lacus]